MESFIAVAGAGAVGCYFGGMLARAGARVLLIGRTGRVEAIERDGLMIDGLKVKETVRLAASADLGAARDAQLVLVAVKTPDTEATGRELARHVAPGVPVLSLQNGVDNAERLRQAGLGNAQPAVVYVAAQMTGPATVRHSGRGDLVLGRFAGSEAIAALFERAGVPCRVSDDVERELWTKLAMNCAYNAISALCRARYGRIADHAGTRSVMLAAVQETVAVARAAGVPLPDLEQDALKLAVAMPQALSSTAQDLERGKRTEIGSLNGYVARRGAELGVAAPVNTALESLVKLLEETNTANG